MRNRSDVAPRRSETPKSGLPLLGGCMILPTRAEPRLPRGDLYRADQHRAESDRIGGYRTVAELPTLDSPPEAAPVTDDQRRGAWSPLDVTAVADVFEHAPFRWFVAGGHALELALGRSWRGHDDVDVGVCREDLDGVHRHLSGGWDMHVAAAGDLAPWDGRPLSPARHENNIWVRRQPDGPWMFDIIVGGGDASGWRSRRDPTIWLPWTNAVREADGIPYLTPKVQLLMKSKDVRPKDDIDAAEVIPALHPEERRWLIDHLPRDHPWRRRHDG